MVNLFFYGMLAIRPMTTAVTKVFSFKLTSNMINTALVML